ncbi:MAG: acetylxylan esterase [Kiritimatiellia bacterium]
MNTNVWAEAGGNILKETLRQEARALHQLHQPPAMKSEWLALRRQVRQRIMDSAGSFPPPPPLCVREHGTIKLKGYRIIKLTYQSRPGLRVTALLFRPDGPGPFPAILNMHGHWSQGKIAGRVVDRCQVFVKAGFAVLSVDAIGAGERCTVPGKFEYHGNQQGVALFSIGESLLGMQVYDNMRAIDLLQTLDGVDGSRIGATGASGGGSQTMWISALDPRVKASVPVVANGTFESCVTTGNCWCETLPDCLKISEQWALMGLVAPNPLLILNAYREGIDSFKLNEMLRSYADARKIYALYGAEEKIAYKTLDRPHGYWPEMQSAALGWFKHWLMGEGSSLPQPLPAVPAIPERRLMCFPGKSRPREVMPTGAYVTIQARLLKKQFLRQTALDRAKKISDLARLVRLPGGPDLAGCGPVVREESEGHAALKFTVESEKGVLIPCTLILPAGKSTTAIIAAHPDGKEACLKTSQAREALAQGKALCLVDLRDIGESRWSAGDDRACLFSARTALLLGRTIAGDWVKDLMAVRAALPGLIGPGKVELMGFGARGTPGLDDPAAKARGAVFGNGETAVAVLAAAALGKNFSGATVVDLLATYVMNGKPPVQRFSVLVPGILKWGDVSLIAALAGCPLKVKSLVSPEGKPLSAAARAAWAGEVRKLAARLGKRSPL